MNTSSETIHHESVGTSSLRWAASGSAMEAFGAMAGIALAIVGLAGVFPSTMAAIATIVLGAAILLEGGSYGASQVVRTGTTEMQTARSGGISADLLGGIAGIVLGILALLGVDALTLLSVALLVFGASFLLSSFSAAEVNPMASGGGVLIGLGAVVLGILAVVGQASLTLVLVGLLALGVHALFSGTTFGARMLSFAHRY